MGTGIWGGETPLQGAKGARGAQVSRGGATKPERGRVVLPRTGQTHPSRNGNEAANILMLFSKAQPRAFPAGKRDPAGTAGSEMASSDVETG